MTTARLLAWIRLPIRDVGRGLEGAIVPPFVRNLALIAVGYCASWWIYVPVHELLHAFGCRAAGGDVARLEIDAMYGAALLRRLFPFVAVGSAYAGRLTGFDTHGNDLVYLATDGAPFVLTVLGGVPLLQCKATARWAPSWRAVCLGAAVPSAFAPFLSLGGDYYEMGSILVSRAMALVRPSFDVSRWRSDDLIKLATDVLPSKGGARAEDIAGLFAGFVVGAALSIATYKLGDLWARWLRRPEKRIR